MDLCGAAMAAFGCGFGGSAVFHDGRKSVSPGPHGPHYLLAGCIGLPNTTALTVARVLKESVFHYFGSPEMIHSDQGAQFESSLTKTL